MQNHWQQLNTVTAAIVMLSLIAGAASAEDWPMYRGDVGRTGETAETVPADASVKWRRRLPTYRPAYRNPRLHFDAGYEPVVADGMVVITSPLTGSITAYDAETGAEQWRYYADGPVRTAAVLYDGRVYAGSDDGYFYCLALKSGKLQWRKPAAPTRRRALGNRRMISVWPVRGGAVAQDGRIYFACGVWPFEGVFVYCVDAEYGKTIWLNDRLGHKYGIHPHGAAAIGGLAPQGYLAIAGEELIVPCSTAFPARLNLETGELIEFKLPVQGRYPGGWFAALDKSKQRDLRRGAITFDPDVNTQEHEDGPRKSTGDAGLSRRIVAGGQTLEFDKGFADVQGKVHSMAVAAGNVYITTRQGELLCYGARTKDAKPLVHTPKRTPVELDDEVVKLSAELLRLAGVRAGHVVVDRVVDARLVAALATNTQLRVTGFVKDIPTLEKMRRRFDDAGLLGSNVTLLPGVASAEVMPPYVATLMLNELTLLFEHKTVELESEAKLALLLRPYGGMLFTRPDGDAAALLKAIQKFGGEDAGSVEAPAFRVTQLTNGILGVQRPDALPGSADYTQNFQPVRDTRVKFPLGVLWFDDELAHFKRSPPPKLVDGVMISYPKDWHAVRIPGLYQRDYPLLPPVLSDIYTGRRFTPAEAAATKLMLAKPDPKSREPSQYRPPRQKDAWKPKQPVVGQRTNALTGQQEPRAFPKTYGCDGGVDYGLFYTMRSGTPAFYDKTLESGTVFLSGPRSGCTNSVIPAGGLLNAPYYYEGCTCSYPLPVAVALHPMPESHEQWATWGASKPQEITRIGINFGAPGDRRARNGALWLDFPNRGGPSPELVTRTTPANPSYRYRHSLWMKKPLKPAADKPTDKPWVFASTAAGIESFSLGSMKNGDYKVRLFFMQPEEESTGAFDIWLQGKQRLEGFNIREAAGAEMTGVVKEFDAKVSDNTFKMELKAGAGDTLISGLELQRIE